MLMIYGPAGAGKSTQGQILAKKLNRKWLSAGQIIRDSHRFDDFTASGAMIDEKILVELIHDEVKKANDEGYEVVFDGQPGSVEQVSYLKDSGLLDKVDGIIVIRVPEEELLKRLAGRGRDDDNEEVWRTKIKYFEEKSEPFFNALSEQGVKIEDVDGTGTMDEVADRIMELNKKFVQK